MSKIKTILSIIFIFTTWGCVSSAYPILLWWPRECVLYLIIIIKPEVWIINHCLGLGHETMVCAVCLTMFLYTTLLILHVPHWSPPFLPWHMISQNFEQHMMMSKLGKLYTSLSWQIVNFILSIFRYFNSMNAYWHHLHGDWGYILTILWQDFINIIELQMLNKFPLLISWGSYNVESRNKTPILAVISYANQVSYQQLFLV